MANGHKNARGKKKTGRGKTSSQKPNVRLTGSHDRPFVKDQPIDTSKPYQPKNLGSFAKVWTDEELNRLSDELLDWFKTEQPIWFKDFFIERHISITSVSSWRKKHDYFRFCYSLCEQMQESLIFKGAMVGNYEKSVSIFFFKAIRKWRENGSQGVLTPDELNALRNEANKLMQDKM